VGTSGSGKTTFARQLAGLLNRTHIELDALHWGPNWTARADFRELVSAAIGEDTWVVDGNYRAVRNDVWGRATAIVWLNYPFHVVFHRALARTVWRLVFREVLYAGNRETFRGAFLEGDGIPWWVIRTYRAGVANIAWYFLSPAFDIWSCSSSLRTRRQLRCCAAKPHNTPRPPTGFGGG
jgi:hypothetical protein